MSGWFKGKRTFNITRKNNNTSSTSNSDTSNEDRGSILDDDEEKNNMSYILPKYSDESINHNSTNTNLIPNHTGNINGNSCINNTQNNTNNYSIPYTDTQNSIHSKNASWSTKSRKPFFASLKSKIIQLYQFDQLFHYYRTKNKTKFFTSLLKTLFGGFLTLLLIYVLFKSLYVIITGIIAFSLNNLPYYKNRYQILDLKDKEYYDYDFQNFDIDTIKKFDQGAEHYFVTHTGELLTDQDKIEVENKLEKLLSSSVDTYDLTDFTGSPEGKENRDHVLIAIPLRNAEDVLSLMFKHLMNLTYPHELIDLAFLVSDCSENDQTLNSLLQYSLDLQNGTLSQVLQDLDDIESIQFRKFQKDLEEQQQKDKELSDADYEDYSLFSNRNLYLKYMDPNYLREVHRAFSPPFHQNYNKPFRSIQIFKKDFGQVIGQGFSDRHAVKVQGVRRKLMGRARNWLVSNSLKPYHSWVYWRDADVELCPGSVIEDLMKFDYDIIVPNVWRPLPTFLHSTEQPYDLNSWIESGPALELARSLDEDDVIVEGYAEYPTWRVHLANLRDPNGNPQDIIDLDGVGGVSILAKAKLFRNGINFPAFTFENHAETEAFGKMAKKMGYRVGGLPHYTLWHIYEPSEDDLKEMAKIERENRRKD
ncbi:Van1p SCDLUD_001265 [Saccharomycodes ludwigii]|uniref:Van1p n=1 Tax=Saccharomycodes ludwigii TaxID=36035 RepID=UPI001E8604B2|nr:hypothetical protein SCDLUD_001265 [Saccharomycodes ludwigii]KAH3903620.1 hypothetical protein SCDLUD_001265 [Saccharomycodes ludwigii]